MTFANDINARLTAALAAVAVTFSLIVTSFSTPQASVIASILA